MVLLLRRRTPNTLPLLRRSFTASPVATKSHIPVTSLVVDAVKTKEDADAGLAKMKVAQAKFAEYSQEKTDAIFEAVSIAMKVNAAVRPPSSCHR